MMEFPLIFKQNELEISTESLTKIIYEFLYEVFKSNLSNFSKLIDGTTDIKDIVNFNDLNYTQFEIEIINSFLNWENDEKNIAVFNISNIALEYCLISNKKGNAFKLESLKDKVFYLDTNIIFRAIGINGEFRKHRITTFLNKLLEAKETLVISKFTFEEIKSTIKYYVSTLNRKYSSKINSNIFIKYSTNADFLEFYHIWRKNRSNDSLELFEAFLLGEIDKIKTEFKIKYDFNIDIDFTDKKIEEIILDKASSINTYKTNEKNYSNYIEASVIDAKNIYLIEKKRNYQYFNIFDCKYYFISSDQYLRKWDYSINRTVPTVILPSQWMSLLLRYLNRSSDDFKSFVSFLNISNNEKFVTNENLQLILKGMSEITTDFDYQNTIIKEMINSQFFGILEKIFSEDDIVTKAKSFAKSTLEKEIEIVKYENKKLESKFEKYQDNTSSAIKNLQQEKNNQRSNNEELIKENKIIKAELINAKVRIDYNKYKSKAYYFIPILFICFLWLFLTFFFTTENWNFVSVYKNYVNNLPENSVEKNINEYVYLLPLSIGVFSIFFIFNRLFNNEKKEEKIAELNEKHSK